MMRLKALMIALVGLVVPLAMPASAEINIQEITSPGGIKAWLVEDHSIPFTALELRFRGGTSLDLPGKRGATYLMAGLLEEGSGEMRAQDYARALENLAASFGYDTDRDSLSVSAQFLSENRDEVVDLLYQTLHQPRFDQDALDRVRAQVLAGLRSDLKDPDKIAGRGFAQMAYGDHPYGSDGKGSLESIAELSRQDMFDAHEAIFARDRLYVSAVGDITPQELGQLLDRLLGDLAATGAPLPGPAQVEIEGGVTIIDYDTPQSVAVFGHAGIARDDPRFFAAYILNQILGGGSFESRLMTEVREKRGLTYGVYSFLVDKDHADLWMGQVQSANNRVAEAIEVIRAQWADIAENGVTQEELDAAKKYLTGAYPLRFDGNGRIANIITGMQIQGMPLDYPATRNDRVNAVTLEEINDVARRYLRPDDLRFVVVGQPEGLSSTN